MFERRILKGLRGWASSEGRKPLMLRGARQVGKTTVINQFGREFENYLYVNLENKDLLDIFENTNHVSDIVMALFMYQGKSRKKGRVLIFIDEIQISSQAIAKLRYFYELLPDIHVIAAGSLLETVFGPGSSAPVGRVEYAAIRPCSFIEFLGAMGEEILAEAVEEARLPAALHSKVMSYFNTYTLIGGMPEVVAHYVKNRDLVALTKVYESILEGYMDDVEKYAGNQTNVNVVRYIIKHGWTNAAQIVTYNKFGGSTYRSREVSDAFMSLEKTFLLELTHPTVDVTIPILPQARRAPKLLWLDTGIVNFAAKLQREVFGAHDITDAWRGRVAEHIVGQELLTLDDRVLSHRNFWVREKQSSSAEVDYVLLHDNKVIPIEVKSGHNAKLKSLHIFMELTNHEIAVRVWAKPMHVDMVKRADGSEFKLINIPFYYVGSLYKVLSEHCDVKMMVSEPGIRYGSGYF